MDLVFHSRTDNPVTLYDVSFVPDLGFNQFSFHVVQEKHKIILSNKGAHLLGGRLVFHRRYNGSSLHATRIIPGTHANMSTALAAFVELPSYRSDGPPSPRSDGPAPPLPNLSVASLVTHQNKTCVSNSRRVKKVVAGISEQNSRVAWETGRESESMLSWNAWMAAAVFPPSGVFMDKQKKWWLILTTSTFPLPTPIRVCRKPPPYSTAFN